MHAGEFVARRRSRRVDAATAGAKGLGDGVEHLGPFRAFQTPIRDIAVLTGLDMDQLVEVDRTPIAVTPAQPV